MAPGRRGRGRRKSGGEGEGKERGEWREGGIEGEIEGGRGRWWQVRLESQVKKTIHDEKSKLTNVTPRLHSGEAEEISQIHK